MADEKESEAERVRRGTASARRSLIIIFGVGFVAIGIAVAFVMRTVPAEVNDDYGAATPPEHHEPAREPCKKFGDPCDLSPGKLGTCVVKEQCTGANCLFCQSSH